jgi:hypothetical protein
MSDPRKELTEVSDELLQVLRDLRAAEEMKRQLTIGTPEFNRLAAEVEQLSERVYRLAAVERSTGERLPLDDNSIGDIEMGSLDDQVS